MPARERESVLHTWSSVSNSDVVNVHVFGQDVL